MMPLAAMRLIAARLCALLGVLAAIGGPASLPSAASAAEGDAAAALEMRIKAAYLYKFASYVDWPEAAFQQKDSPLRIVIAGADNLTAELAGAVKGETFNGRPISVQSLRQSADLNGAHIVFLSKAESGRLPALRQAPQGPFLVVSENEGALRQGAVINFLVVGGQVRFEISLESAKQRNLRLSSRLLTVAHRVETSEGEPTLYAAARQGLRSVSFWLPASSALKGTERAAASRAT